MAARPFISASVLIIMLLSGGTAGRCAPPPTPPPTTGTATTTSTTAPATAAGARPDGEVWARRNVDLLRSLAERAGQPKREGEDGMSLVEFSLIFNRMLIREPYAGEIRKLAEAASAAETDPKRQQTWDQVARFLELPEPERHLRLAMDNSIELDEPLIDAGNEQTLTKGLRRLSRRATYEQYLADVVRQMDEAARQAGNWDGLALAYADLAYDAQRRQRLDLARDYARRMLGILREHPDFQDPRRGNTDGVDPAGVAALLLDLNLQDELHALIDAHDGQVKVDLIGGLVTALARNGDFDAVRDVAERRLRLVAPRAAARVVAAMDGRVLPPPGPATTQARQARRERDPAEERLSGIESTIAHAHARRGNVDVAARMLITLQQRGRAYSPAGPDELACHEWARLAYDAHRGGHDGIARQTFEKALSALSKERSVDADEFEETSQFVREALSVGAFEPAHRVLNTSGGPRAWGRQVLADAHLARGNERRARELFDEAVELAQRDRGGSAMAEIAVTLHRLGDEKRAEQLLPASLEHIAGEDFGLGGSADVVYAAMRMGRLDLLDRLYEQSERGERMLLCIAACNLAAAADAEDE
jgi:tetratricopeptide (TPR) repeat protein